MILQSLTACYDRLQAAPDILVPSYGYSKEKLSFSIVLSSNGNVLRVNDLRGGHDKKKIACSAILPKPPRERSGTKAPAYFLWDKSKYILGAELKEGKQAFNKFCFTDFYEQQVTILKDCDDEAGLAVLNFLKQREYRVVPDWAHSGLLEGGFIAFELDGSHGFIHDRPKMKECWNNYLKTIRPTFQSQCLVTGEKSSFIPEVHSQIKGVKGAQGTGAALISFNSSSLESHGKGKSNYNAPISEKAAFAYTTALNYLLLPENKRKLVIGDTTVVFWTDTPSPAETLFDYLFGDNAPEGDDRTRSLEGAIRKIVQGDMPHELGNTDTPVYFLALSPNAARLSVRFWFAEPLGAMVKNLRAHFAAIALTRSFDHQAEFPRLYWMVRELAPQGKTQNISPLLTGQLMQSILYQRPYPQTLLTATLARIRADKNITYLRGCMLKAFLTRNSNQEISMSLDGSIVDVGYLLGRLFAAIERIQENAAPGINTTVREKFFSVASATPARAFPVILRNAQYGLGKIRKENAGRGIFFDKLIQDIVSKIEAASGFPASMNMEKQAMFVLGYYQQRQALFSKKEVALEVGMEK